MDSEEGRTLEEGGKKEEIAASNVDLIATTNGDGANGPTRAKWTANARSQRKGRRVMRDSGS